MPSASLGISDIYRYIFAGNTVIKSKIIANAAIFLVCLKISDMPNTISKNPLNNTTSFLQIIYGGTIFIKKSIFIKC